MNLRRFFTLLGVALLWTATAADAKVHRVHPGESIQAAIDGASPGDTILVEPGTYEETGNAEFGLHITTDNLRLIGKVKNDADSDSSSSSSSKLKSKSKSKSKKAKAKDGATKVRLLHTGTQKTGVYAAPEGCGPGLQDCPEELKGFYIRGFSVEGFPVNGIQTRFVNGFKMIRNESIDNLNNGLYPTLSANGLVQNNFSYGSLDTALWVAGSENVRVIGNELTGAPTGLEITVANNVLAKHNNIHSNSVGVGLYHPNAAGNDQLPVMANWVIENNHIHDNNLANPAPSGSFQAGLPSGIGVLVLGVSDHVVSKNRVENNDFIGIGVLGWCTATALGDASRSCSNDEPQADPSVNNLLISQNRLRNNGGNAPDSLPVPGVDILLLHVPPPAGPENAIGNCFEKNKPSTFTFFYPGGDLPTDGC